MKTKLFFGLCGVSANGVLFSPSGKRLVRLPRRIAFAVHSFVNHHLADVGLVDPNDSRRSQI